MTPDGEAAETAFAVIRTGLERRKSVAIARTSGKAVLASSGVKNFLRRGRLSGMASGIIALRGVRNLTIDWGRRVPVRQ